MDATVTQYRKLTPEEADKLMSGDIVWVMEEDDFEPIRCTVRGWHKNESVRVVNRAGHVFDFDVDHPDYRPDGDDSPRKSPVHHESPELSYYLVTAVADDNLAGLLAASIPFVELRSRLTRVEDGIHRVNNILQGTPTVQQFEALAADYIHLLERVRALEAMLRPKAVA